MVHIYEKVCKTIDNEYGIIERNESDILKQGPCVITILALTFGLKDVNGAMRQVAESVNPDIDNSYNPERRIFGLGFGEYNKEQDQFSKVCGMADELKEFVEKYFCPLFIQDNQKINYLEAMKNFRNINFVTYCNGTNSFNIIENLLKVEMTKVGYSDNEISLILSQICLAAISGNVLRRDNVSTSALAVTFGDISDGDFSIGFGMNYDKRKAVFDMPRHQGFINQGSSIAFARYGNDDHSFKRHMTGDDVLSPMIKCFLDTSINNALLNKESSYFEPITYAKIEEAFTELNKGKALK
ncbi:MAG: hypothetical protein IJR82_03790 [Bacilli bacterium]|nr:hypothetical protein [Bacilli bacterium]